MSSIRVNCWGVEGPELLVAMSCIDHVPVAPLGGSIWSSPLLENDVVLTQLGRLPVYE